MRERIERPVTDKGVVSFLAGRAGAFRIGTAGIPLTIDTANIVDVGAEVKSEARFVAPVDLEKSPAVAASIKASTGADRATAHVTAVLASHVVPGRGDLQYRDTLFVSVVAKDLKRAALWRVENGTYKRVYDGAATGAATTFAAGHAPVIGALASNLTVSTATLVPGDAFSPQDSPPKQELGTNCHSNSECLSGNCVSLAFVPPTSFAQSQTTSASQTDTTPYKCAPADGTGEVGDFCTKNAQCKTKDCSGTGTSKKCNATPKKLLGQSCALGTDCASGACAPGYLKCVPADNTGNLGEFCTASVQCKSQTCTTSKCTTPPPTLYDAYGATGMCNHYCSSASCAGCCVAWAGAETNLLIMGAIACHTAASIWIWAQIACAVVETATAMAIGASSAVCGTTCNMSYPQTAQANPNSCSLTR